MGAKRIWLGAWGMHAQLFRISTSVRRVKKLGTMNTPFSKLNQSIRSWKSPPNSHSVSKKRSKKTQHSWRTGKKWLRISASGSEFLTKTSGLISSSPVVTVAPTVNITNRSKVKCVRCWSQHQQKCWAANQARSCSLRSWWRTTRDGRGRATCTSEWMNQ